MGYLRSGVRLVATLTAAASTSVVAQTQAVQENTAQQRQGGLEEIVVTAQRRSENLQDVPIAVSTVSEESLATFGIASTSSLQMAVPGLVLGRISGSGTSAFLRGVGAGIGSQGAEPPVAMYIDDIYLGSPQSDLLDLANVERVEVLKGPQGTLFGRNATGGLINVHTKRPSHDVSFDGKISYGNFESVEGSIYATGPLTDNVAMNVAINGRNQADGFGFNATRNEDIYKGWGFGLRSQLLWEPSSQTKVLVSGDYSKHYDRRELMPLPGTISSGGAVGVDGSYRTFNTVPVGTRFRSGGVSLRVEQDLGFAELLNITSYREYGARALFDQDLAAVDVVSVENQNRTKNFTQELQLQSQNDGPLNWIVGAFYFRSSVFVDRLRITGTSAGANGFTDFTDNQILNSIAGFAEVSYEILPKMKLTVGARYTKDRYSIDVGRRFNAAGATLAAPYGAKASFSEPTYRAILDYNFTDDVMVYASFSHGFKSGGFNVSSPGAPPAGDPPFRPETIDAYEVGVKSQFLDDSVRLNIAAFTYKYSDLQVVNSITGASVIVNAAKATIKGIDFDATVVPISGLTITAAGSFLDAQYDVFPAGPDFILNPAVCTPSPLNTGPFTGGARRCNVNLAGNTLARAPKFTGSLSFNYELPTSIGYFNWNAALYHNSGFFWEAGNNARQASYQIVNAGLKWEPESKRFEVGVWVKNLTDEYYFTHGQENTFGYAGFPSDPRTYGVTFGVHF